MAKHAASTVTTSRISSLIHFRRTTKRNEIAANKAILAKMATTPAPAMAFTAPDPAAQPTPAQALAEFHNQFDHLLVDENGMGAEFITVAKAPKVSRIRKFTSTVHAKVSARRGLKNHKRAAEHLIGKPSTETEEAPSFLRKTGRVVLRAAKVAARVVLGVATFITAGYLLLLLQAVYLFVYLPFLVLVRLVDLLNAIVSFVVSTLIAFFRLPARIAAKVASLIG